MSHWEEPRDMSSRADTLRQTQDELEGLHLPAIFMVKVKDYRNLLTGVFQLHPDINETDT